MYHYFRRGINLAVAKYLLVVGKSAVGEFYKRRGQLISQVTKTGTITGYVKRQWKVFS
jgi:hypothetical protein